MTLRDLWSTGAPAAYQFYFSRHQKPEEWIGWMVLCYPLTLAYVRKMRQGEVYDIYAPRYGAGRPRFGLFNQFSGACLALGYTEEDLVRVAYQLGRTPVYAH